MTGVATNSRVATLCQPDWPFLEREGCRQRTRGGASLFRVHDPRRRLWAWLDSRPFPEDALVSGALFFVIGWPMLATVESDWSADGALTFALVAALPMGALIAYRRRRRSASQAGRQ